MSDKPTDRELRAVNAWLTQIQVDKGIKPTPNPFDELGIFQRATVLRQVRAVMYALDNMPTEPSP